MQSRTIVAKPLTRDNFSAFGDVIEASEQVNHFPINDGNSERFHDLATVDVGDGRTLINIFRSKPLIESLEQPLAIKMMERHPLGSQAFMPLSDQPYLVVVAPKGELKTDLIEVFLASNRQGVNYHTGTWHHYCLALNQVSDFMVIDRGGDCHNCDVETLDGSIVIMTNEQDK
ncbi:MAG: ureidoglycolate lyase [Phenylobacterium sp.]|jgi:ureidoglycolate lyase